MINQIFVYGTLQRGQCRESLWPAAPLSVLKATVRAKLFVRDDYPAIIEGENPVHGELWTFEKETIHRVLRELDQVEGCDQPDLANLYDRVMIETSDPQGRPLGTAWTYFYANDPAADGFRETDRDRWV